MNNLENIAAPIAWDVLLFSKDLLFITKVKEVGIALQRTVLVAKNLNAASEALKSNKDRSDLKKRVILVDLEKGAGTFEEMQSLLTEDLAVQGDESAVKIVGFFSHLNVEVGRKATEAGFFDVLPRSAFVRVLPDLIGV